MALCMIVTVDSGRPGGAVNGYDAVVGITQGVSDLQFEEDEEEAFYMKDLPKHACA